MWYFLLVSLAAGSDVWQAKRSNGTVVFTDSPPSMNGYEPFLVDGPPPEVAHVTLKNFPLLDTWDDLIVNASARYGVEQALIKAVMLAESGMNTQALSHAGAMGLMQLMPGTAAELGVTDAHDPQQCVDGGTRYLRKMLDLFNGDHRLALAGYNAGPTRVLRKMAVPAIEETQTYVKRVQQLYRFFSTQRPIRSETP